MSNGESAAGPVVVAVKVNFELNTPDRLRRVVFGLEKDNAGDTLVWKIGFKLFERESPSEDFGDAVVDLDVEVDEALHPNAESAAQNGLSPAQTAHALGPASDDVKAAAAGEIGQDDANDTVQQTLKP